jgi:hypothetical protein
MTEEQRAKISFDDAMYVFDDDIDALSVAVAGFLTRHDNMKFKGLVSRDLRAGRYTKYLTQLNRVPSMTEEEIKDVWFIRRLAFGEIKGQLIEIYTQIKKTNNEINRYKSSVETNNIIKCIEKLNDIKRIIHNRTVESYGKNIENTRQGTLF